jgi:hypothetical protein
MGSAKEIVTDRTLSATAYDGAELGGSVQADDFLCRAVLVGKRGICFVRRHLANLVVVLVIDFLRLPDALGCFIDPKGNRLVPASAVELAVRSQGWFPT